MSCISIIYSICMWFKRKHTSRMEFSAYIGQHRQLGDIYLVLKTEHADFSFLWFALIRGQFSLQDWGSRKEDCGIVTSSPDVKIHNLIKKGCYIIFLCAEDTKISDFTTNCWGWIHFTDFHRSRKWCIEPRLISSISPIFHYRMQIRSR